MTAEERMLENLRCTRPGCPDRPTLVHKGGYTALCYWCGLVQHFNDWRPRERRS